MSTVESREIGEILDRIRAWPPRLRLKLARRVLESLESPSRPRKITIPLERAFGLLKTDAPPPTDEECRRIIEEERTRKHL